jgi:hypothetical protein
MGTESIETKVAEKIQHYCTLIDQRAFKNPIVLFITIMPNRCDSFLDRLHYFPREYAKYFATASISYDRFLSRIPELTSWAVTTQYRRAGYEPFKFIREEVNKSGR